MAPPTGTLRAGRYFLALGLLFAVLYLLVFLPGRDHTPKLGLDLVGGAQVVLKASTTDGRPPSADAMNEARTIIENRVNGRGVSNSEVAIQGGDSIVVTIPGKRADDIENVGNTALLAFRPLVAGPFVADVSATPSASPVPSGSTAPTDTTTPTDTTSPAATSAATAAPTTSGAAPQAAVARPIAADSTAPASAPATGTAASTDTAPADTAAATDTAPADTTVPTAGTSPSAAAEPTAAPSVPGAADVTQDQIAAWAQTNAQAAGVSTLTEDQVRAIIAFRCGTDQPSTDTNAVIVACSQDKTIKYLLNKQLFPGTEVDDATALAPNAQTGGGWTVSLALKSTGKNIWSTYTGTHNCGGTDCPQAGGDPADFVAFALDGTVISAPGIKQGINTDTQISGSFTQTTATDLANSLKYGALPLSFALQTSQTVSATLGTAQLQAGLLAGGIGLVLVVIYSLLYYRGLGLVTLASLVVSAGIVYASICILGEQIGFTLTLAGVAGFIVAVGITADSFVVFFERIKDEVHDGRSMRVAVPRAWTRARRTILSADVVSLLAAAVLYFLAAGDVRGFAFTLGLSTIIDIVVVFWFTHPVVSVLSRSAAFGSARFTGLNAVRRAAAAERPADRVEAAASARRAPARRARAAATRDGDVAPRGGVAVLEQDDVAVPDDGVDGEVVVTDVVVESPPAPRTPVEPVGGTAAERAAARRARLKREQEDRS